MTTINAQLPAGGGGTDHHGGYFYIPDGQTITVSAFKAMFVFDALEVGPGATLINNGEVIIIT